MPVIVTPQTNETLSPMQFDGTVLMGGVNASGGLPAVSPGSMGLQGWSFPLAAAAASSSAANLTNGTLYLAGMYLPAGLTLTQIAYATGSTAAGTPTASQCFMGLYNAAGTRVGVTADISGNANIATANAGVIAAFTTPVQTTTAGLYWGALSLNATTAGKVLCAGTGTATTSAQLLGSATIWPGITAANFLFAVNGTGLTTSIPSSITPSSNSATAAYPFWMGVG